jgi:hypothetical protein
MEDCYKEVGKTGMSIACENGHSPLVKYYLPLYVEFLENDPKVISAPQDLEQESLSIFSEKAKSEKATTVASHVTDVIIFTTFTPI